MVRPMMLGLVSMLMIAGPAWAGDDEKHQHARKPLKVKIDDLSAELRSSGSDWVLRIPYEIEVENARGGEQLVLQMAVLEAGGPLLDGDGYQIVLLADMVCPDRAGDVEFEQSMTIRIPKELVASPRDLRIDADIRLAGEDAPLDHDDCRVKLRVPTTYVRRGWGVHLHHWH